MKLAILAAMNPVQLIVEPLVFDGPATENRPGLKLTVKRYTSPTSDDEGLTLLFAHCVAAHKELWEPSIERLFQLQQSKGKQYRIREAYSFDRQNHGTAAVLNEETLRSHPGDVSGYEWASAIAEFVKAYHLHDRRTVAIGHSAGTSTLMCTSVHLPQEPPPYLQIVLVEPTITPRYIEDEHGEVHQFARQMAVQTTEKRRDTWDDKDSALTWLAKRPPWKSWDRRVLRLHVEHGLRSISTPQGNSVTLMCNKWQEARGYENIEIHMFSAEVFKTVCKKTPIHIIWGADNIFNPQYIKDALNDVSQGRRAASVTTIEDAGHMIVQEQPDALAQVISGVLDTVQPIPSKL